MIIDIYDKKKNNNKEILTKKLRDSKHYDRICENLNNKLNKKNTKKVIIITSIDDNNKNNKSTKDNNDEIIINDENNINNVLDDLFTFIKRTCFLFTSSLIKSMRFIKST